MQSVNDNGSIKNQTYVRAFLTETPEVGLDILQSRFSNAQKLDTELAEYFKERAQIEDQYAKSLVKATKKLFMSDPTILGHLAPVWTKLQGELTEVSNIHGAMSHSILNEIEAELRTAPQRYQKSNQGKKAIDRGGSILFKRGASSKSLNQDVDPSWFMKGPDILAEVETDDRQRLQRLSNLIQKFEEIQAEHLRQRISMADTTLSTCLSYVPDDEIKDFARTHSKNLKVGQPAAPSPAGENAPSSSPRQGSQVFDDVTPTSSTPVAPRPVSTLSSSRRASSRDSKLFSAFSIRRKPKGERLDDNPNFYPQMEYASADAQAYSQPSRQYDSGLKNTQGITKSERSTEIGNNTVPKVDEQGYSIPPANRSLIPGSIGEEVANDGFFDDENQRITNHKYHVDIKQNAVQEEKEEDKVTMQRMASILKEKNSPSPRRPRGRRDPARNSTLNERLPTDSSLNVNPSHGLTRDASVSTLDSNSYNPFTSSANEAHHTPRTLTPSSSVSVSPTMGSMELPSIATPLPTVEESSTPSLSAYIIETVNARLKGGEADQKHISGEIALQYSGPVSSADMLVFKLDKNDRIESLYPNNHLLQAISEEDGTFGIGKDELARLKGRSVVCFKYKLKGQDITNREILPLSVIPAWRVEETCTKLIVKYKANAAMTTKNMAIWVRPTSKGVTSVQSTPQGAWNPERHVLSWDSETLKMDGSLGQLLAMFNTSVGSAPQPMVALTFNAEGATASNISFDTSQRMLNSNQQYIQIQVIHKTLRSGRVIAGP
ncbi:hypothetical protein INT43_002685 [Umbelopsis isabellina]|uniref:MHD domain-containing protein n=1 Tax=Mortierella isabellina TaxID=91625 RepID=A0A8H7ULK2_MORIS|nr:hypothetical protein INT43_002685 [Umbelopsis isabellina]